jgi:hypothetical protein
MVKKSPDFFLSITAFVLYIAGGIGIFGGIALVALIGGQDLFGWGSAKTIGYLLMCTGVCFSIIGVLFLRLVRNRTNILLSQRAASKENP